MLMPDESQKMLELEESEAAFLGIRGGGSAASTSFVDDSAGHVTIRLKTWLPLFKNIPFDSMFPTLERTEQI